MRREDSFFLREEMKRKGILFFRMRTNARREAHSYLSVARVSCERKSTDARLLSGSRHPDGKGLWEKKGENKKAEKRRERIRRNRREIRKRVAKNSMKDFHVIFVESKYYYLFTGRNQNERVCISYCENVCNKCPKRNIKN